MINFNIMETKNYVSPSVEMLELVLENGILQMSGEDSNVDWESVFDSNTFESAI